MENNQKLIFKGELHEAPVNVSRMVPLKSRGTIHRHTHITLHENAGSINRAALVRYLNKKNYGYHIVVDAEGHCFQYADLNTKLNHGGKANRTGLGIVFLNPYYPHLVNTENEYFEQELLKYSK